ncbi:hypothetical protein STIAU_3572, partial [Stigmatella aurantiaca DW4/3-1]
MANEFSRIRRMDSFALSQIDSLALALFFKGEADMAEITEKSRVEMLPTGTFKLSWGAILGGTFVALGV